MTEDLFKGLPDYIKDSILKIKFNMSENILSYKLPLSLEYLALIRIAISLWQQQDIVVSFGRLIDPFFADFSFEGLYRDHWPVIEKQVGEKVNSLKIPKTCRNTLEEIINSIGKQILKYISFHYHPELSSDELKFFYFNKICWNSQGTLNTLKTGEALVVLTDLSITDRYIIACNNCNEKEIRKLHDRLPKDFLNLLSDKKFRLVLFWTYKIRDELTKFNITVRDDRLFEFSTTNNVNCYIFEWAIKYENEVAVEYIWKNFVDEEMESNLRYYAKECSEVRYSDSLDIYCFLLSRLKEDQILVLLQKKTLELIKRFLDDWRWSEVFITMAKYIIKFIKDFKVIDAMVILFCWNDNVFEEEKYEYFFKDTIEHFQNEIPQFYNQILFNIFPNLFKKDIDLYKLFLDKITVAMKKNFMYGYGLYHCTPFIQNGKLDYLNLGLKEMVESEVKVKNFKDSYLKRRGFETCSDMIVSDKYNEVDIFLDDFIGDKEKIKCYKNLLISMKGEYILSNLKRREYKKKFLTWCFDGNQEDIDNYCSEAD